jgi:hypothetical protein
VFRNQNRKWKNIMKKHPVRSDKRYTITKEFCGYQDARFVVRFCGDWVAQSQFYASALVRAVGESAIRRGAVAMEGKPA